jgi:hypothetical protein
MAGMLGAGPRVARKSKKSNTETKRHTIYLKLARSQAARHFVDGSGESSAFGIM